LNYFFGDLMLIFNYGHNDEFLQKYIEVFKNGHFKNVQNQKSQNTFEKKNNINIINCLKLLKETNIIF